MAWWPIAPRGSPHDSTNPIGGHAHTGQYLHWAKVRSTAQCWWCQCPSQTRDHLFKVCPHWKMQQMVVWAEVLKVTKCGKSRWTARDLLAGERCERAVFDFLPRTDVARLVPPLEEEGVAGSEVSGLELRKRREREEERASRAEEMGAARGLRDGGERSMFLPTPYFMASAGEE